MNDAVRDRYREATAPDGRRERALRELASVDAEELAAVVAGYDVFDGRRIARAAREVGGEAAVELCLRLLEMRGVGLLHWPLVDALASLDHSDVGSALVDAYCLAPPRVRSVVAEELEGHVEDELATALRLAATDDLSYPKRKRSARRLRREFRLDGDARRELAAVGLGTLGTERAVRGLTAELSDPDARPLAIVGLSEAPLELAAGPLARACREHPTSRERASGVLRDRCEESVDAISAEPAEELLDSLVSVAEPTVRANLVRALEAAAPPDVLASLPDDAFDVLAACTDLPDAEDREAAVSLLYATRREAAVQALAEFFDDGDPDVRAAAAGRAASVGYDVESLFDSFRTGTVSYLPSEAHGAEPARDLVPELWDLLGDPAARVRKRACGALGSTGDPRALRPLVYRLTSDDRADVRAAAARALGQIGHPAAVRPLRRALERDRPAVQKRAVSALGHPAFDCTEVLADVLDDHDDETVRGLAATALAFHPESGLEPLCDALLEDRAPLPRQNAATALERLGDPAAVPALERATDDEDERVVDLARSALATLRD